MAGTFFGLETATRALRMNQAVLDVIGHNVSNVDTPGYSRQATEIRATDPYRSNAPGLSNLALGTGVELSRVSRVRDEFVEMRLGEALADQGRFRQLSDTLSRIQSAFNDPGEAGLNSALTTFFNGFQDVSTHPESIGPRTMVQHYSADVAKQFRDIHSTLNGSKLDVIDKIRGMITRVNELATEIADLNLEVQKAVSLGGQPNDLMDRRDALVQELTKMVGAEIVIEQDGSGKKTGSVNLSVGGVPLVQAGTVVPLPTDFAMYRGEPVLMKGKDRVPIRSGELAGLIQSSAIVQSYVDELNTLASKFIQTVNAQHAAGYGLDGKTGRKLFSGTNASNMALDPAIAADPQTIAAATAPVGGGTPAPGNGDNARAISNIAHQAMFGTITMQDRYAQTVTRVGADTQSYERQVNNQGQIVQQMTNLHNSVSGVSMDEELAKMVAYQRSYQAAARLVTAFDEVIVSLLTALG